MTYDNSFEKISASVNVYGTHILLLLVGSPLFQIFEIRNLLRQCVHVQSLLYTMMCIQQARSVLIQYFAQANTFG